MFKKYFVLLIVFLGFIIPITAMAGDGCSSAYYHHGEIIEYYDSNNNNKIEYGEAKNAMDDNDTQGSDLSADQFMAVIRFMFYDCVIPTQENDPVSGTLSVDKAEFSVGETIELTVTGQDDDGLEYLWAHYQGAWHKDYADGTDFVSKFTFSESKPGIYIYKGYIYGKEPTGLKETAWTEPKTVRVTVTAVTQSCNDSDKGKNYYVKGTVTQGNLSQTDECAYCTGLLPTPVTCGAVKEYYCGGNEIKAETHICPSGCKDGACIREEEKSITVISPNGGENWDINKTYDITWDSSGISSGERVKIIFSEHGVDGNGGMITKTYNTGSYSWDIDKQSVGMGKIIPAGDYYKINMCSITDNPVCDESDNYFSIVSIEQNDPVSGTFSVNKTEFSVGETIELTITGQDDDGLYMIWADYQNTWHRDYADGTDFTSKFTFSESEPGTYVYKGYVYGKEPDGSREGSWTEPKTVRVTVTADVNKYPDLTITGAEISDNDGKLYYTVKNQGNALAPTSQAFFTVDSERGGTDYVSSLSPGSSNKFYFDNWECGVPGQSYRIGICADWNHQVTESNEDNNCYNVTLTCPEEQVVDCDTYGQSYWCSSYDGWAQECQGQGKVAPLGNQLCNSGSNQYNYCVTCEQPEDNITLTGGLLVSKTSVRVGESFDLTISAQDGDGIKMMKAFWDNEWHAHNCDDQTSCIKTYTLKESNPGDYYYYGYLFGLLSDGKMEYDWTSPKFVKVTVGEAVVQGSDLTISSVSVNPSSPDTSDEISFDITIKNIGDEKMPYANGGIITQVSSNSLPSPGYRICDAMTKRLDAGESDVIDCPIVQTLSDGTHGFTFLTDSSNRLSETNENNNEKTKIFSVVSGGTTQSCTDSDGGDLYTRGYCNDSRNINNGWDICSDAIYKGGLLEYICTDSYLGNVCGTKHYSCPNGCENGACIEEQTTCTDSDGGKNYYVKGVTSDVLTEGGTAMGDWTDICLKDHQTALSGQEDIIFEGYCDEQGIGRLESGPSSYHCPNGCANGVCIQ